MFTRVLPCTAAVFLFSAFASLGANPSASISVNITEAAATQDIAKGTAGWVGGIDPKKPDALGFTLTTRETKPTLVMAKLDLSKLNANWEGCSAVKLVIYSPEATGAHLNIQFVGREPYANSYRLFELSADWSGWKTFVIPAEKLAYVARDPNFHKDHFAPLKEIQFLNTGWKVQQPESGQWAVGSITFVPDVLSAE